MKVNDRALDSHWSWITATAVAACFGPYFVGGLRTEQIAFYGLTVWSLLLVAFNRKYISQRSPKVLVGLWIGIAAIATLATVSGTSWFSRGRYSFSLQEVDNWVMPIASLTLAWSVAQVCNRCAILVSYAYTLTFFLTLNCGVQIVQLVQGPSGPIVSALRPFWSGASTGYADSRGFASVGERVFTSERLTGVVNQPTEAGILYSLGLIVLVWAYRSDHITFRKFILIAPIITLGGILTISKAFILIGIPLSLALLIYGATFTKTARALGATILMLLGAWVVLIRREWSRSDGLLEWLIGLSSIRGASGGRYGTESGLYGVTVRGILDNSPIIGFGLDPYVLTDSELVRVLASSGLVGLALLLGFYWTLFRYSYRLKQELDRQTWLLSLAVVVLLIGGGLGVATIPANRVGSLLVFVVGILLCTGQQRPVKRKRCPAYKFPKDLGAVRRR